MAPILGYWDIRGLATPIRLLLSQAGIEFEDKLYTCGPPPTFDKGQWTNDKFALGLDFPNLPYYIDGDVKLTQSHVILRHLGRKHEMAGSNEQEMVRAELLSSQVYDFHMDYARTIAYNPEHEKNKPDYTKNLADRLKALSDFLGEAKFVVGDSVTYADFVLYEYLEGQAAYQPEVLKDYPKLAEFVKRVNELEGVKKYFSSSKAIKSPFNGGPAFIAGPYSDLLAQKQQ